MRFFTSAAISIALVSSVVLSCFTTTVAAQEGEWSQLEPAGDPISTTWGFAAISDTREVLVAASTGVDGDSARFFISRDSGGTWEEVVPGDTPGSAEWFSVAMSANGQIILAGGRDGQVYLSTDTGETWDEFPVGSNNSRMSVAMSDDGQTMLAGESGAGDGKAHLSTNSGGDWTEISPTGNPSDEQYRGASVSGDGQTMLIHQGSVNGTGDLHRSQDGGQSWSLVTPLEDRGIESTAISQDGQVMLIGEITGDSFNQAHMSHDGGDTWTDLELAGEAGHQWYVSLDDSGENALIHSSYSGDDFYVYYTNNSGESWEVVDLDELFEDINSIQIVVTSGDGNSYLLSSGDRLWLFAPLTPVAGSGGSTETGGPTQSAPSAPQCQSGAPTSTPDLFQIDVNNWQATVYFAPANNADRYYISYGDELTTGQYGAEFVTGRSTGVIGYTISYLQPAHRYTFTIRGGNECMPGEWSNQMTVNTRRSPYGGTSYYKNFIARVFAYFPKQVDYVRNEQVLGVASEVQATDHCANRPVQVEHPLLSLLPEIFGIQTALRALELFTPTCQPANTTF